MGNRNHLSVTAVNSERLLVEWNWVRSYRHQAARQEPRTDKFRNTPKSINGGANLQSQLIIIRREAVRNTNNIAKLALGVAASPPSELHRTCTQFLPLGTARYISDLADKATNVPLQKTEAATSGRTALPN